MEPHPFTEAPQILGTAKVLGRDLITKYDRRESETLSRILVEAVTGRAYQSLILHPEAVFLPSQYQLWCELSARLLAGEPIQYVIGKAWFAGLELLVGPAVLIPRPETEELVAWALEDCPSDRAFSMLDIGTGSGCIALAVASFRPQAFVTAIDCSPEALAIARDNAHRLKLSCTFRLLDVLQAPPREFSNLDLILSNPPYIPQSEYEALEPHVRDHEPALALAVPDHDPLLYYNKVSELALHWLKPGGKLRFEIHTDFGQQVISNMRELGWQELVLRQDISGRDRMVGGTKPLH